MDSSNGKNQKLEPNPYNQQNAERKLKTSNVNQRKSIMSYRHLVSLVFFYSHQNRERHLLTLSLRFTFSEDNSFLKRVPRIRIIFGLKAKLKMYFFTESTSIGFNLFLYIQYFQSTVENYE